MDNTTVARILAAYGILHARLLPVEKGYRNESHPVQLPDGERLNLIVYKREPGMADRIRRANRVADAVAEQGIPARRTYNPRIMRLQSGAAAKYAALYTYLPGRTIPWEGYTMVHLKLLGKTMGDLHGILQTVPTDDLPPVTDEYLAITRCMERYFTDAGVRQAMARKLGIALTDVPSRFRSLQHMLEQCHNIPGQQALHMDFVRGNILFMSGRVTRQSPQVSGVLDFEKTAAGHPVFDIARTYAFLLVDCKYKPADKIRKYFLRSGYSKRSTAPIALTPNTLRLLEGLTTLFLLHDFYKFLLHNPYEYLHTNDHYLRTRAALVDRQVLAVIQWPVSLVKNS